jgi:hypothetical protein
LGGVRPSSSSRATPYNPVVRLINHSLSVGRGAEVQTAGRNTSDYARLCGQGNEINDFLFIGDRSNRFGQLISASA